MGSRREGEKSFSTELFPDSESEEVVTISSYTSSSHAVLEVKLNLGYGVLSSLMPVVNSKLGVLGRS